MRLVSQALIWREPPMLAEVVAQQDVSTWRLLVPGVAILVAIYSLFIGVYNHHFNRNVLNIDLGDGIHHLILFSFIAFAFWVGLWQTGHSQYVESLAIKDKYHLDAIDWYDSKRIMIQKGDQECLVKFDTNDSQLNADGILCLPNKPVINLDANR